MNAQTKRLARLLQPLSSLTLTVVLLALSMVLIFAGTTVQTEMGIWDVQRRFFHSWLCIIDWRLFFPLWNWGNKNIPGAMPFPGGFTLITLLLINLLSAHAVRFKLSWKRSGILILHAGLILLLVGEVITAKSAVESQMVIDNGSSSNWSEDIRDIELAITDRSPADQDVEVIVPRSKVEAAQTIENSALPFTVKIERFFPNTGVAGPQQTNIKAPAVATAGTGKELRLFAVPTVTGTDSEVNAPSAYVTLTRSSGESLGTYIVSTMPPLIPQMPAIDRPQIINVDGKEYWMQLRFKREYKPYTMHLIKFSHDRYTGTDTPKNFSSLVRLVDPTRHVDSEFLIWMNHPLRYNGETFYQASFKVGDQTTVLQVVRNPGWLIPYVSCSMVGLGLLIHFGMHLFKFLSRRFAEQSAYDAQGDATPSPAMSRSPLPAGNGNGASGSVGAAVLERPKLAIAKAINQPRPQPRGKVTWVPAAVITGALAIYLLALLSPAKSKSAYDMDTFARIPISYEGRTMPLDSLARNTLRILSHKQELVTEADEKNPKTETTADTSDDNRAINWLLDVFVQSDKAREVKVFRIDHPDVKAVLGLDDAKKLFSIADISLKIDKLQDEYLKVKDVKNPDGYQRSILDIARRWVRLGELSTRVGSLYLSPPLVNPEWRALGPVMAEIEKSGQRDPGAEAFVGMLEAYHDKQPQQFNQIATEYASLLSQKLPDVSRKLDIEVRLNMADPFAQCMALYVIVFVLAAGSWMVWHRPLAKAALWVLVLALVWHTMALITRIYLQGRPPVTNLYSSAIFIAWAAVLFCVGLELIYRNGIASAAAAALAFPSLMIAGSLAADGDTMKMLQAVLDTNIWLATHVVVVALGYTATFLSGFLAIGYVLGSVLSRGFNADVRKNLYRMVYGVVCFAILFSFVGTILGGIWADQSWGRFWGWDPKENGAVLIVLWNAISLHARWGGLVRERGFMLLTIGGNIVTAWSWFGTNMLGVGLHSYGFMDSALFWLASWVGLQLLIIGIGLIPQHLWRSNQTNALAAS